MRFKKLLCLLLSLFMLGNFCTFVSAGKCRTDKASRDYKKGLSSNWAYTNGKRKGLKRVEVRPSTCKVQQSDACHPSLTHISNFDEKGGSVPQKAKECAEISPKNEDETKHVDVEEKASSDKKQYVIAKNPFLDCLDLMSFDDVTTPEFTNMIAKSSIFVRVSDKFRIYYNLWKEIELKFIELKHTFSKDVFSEAYSAWWEDITHINTRVVTFAPEYFADAYNKAREYEDVFLFDEMYQIKVINHMQEEWKIGSKFFNMATVTNGYRVWCAVEKMLDQAIEVECLYRDSYKIGV